MNNNVRPSTVAVVILVVVGLLLICGTLQVKDEMDARRQTPQSVAATANVASSLDPDEGGIGALGVALFAVVLTGGLILAIVKQTGNESGFGSYD